MDKYLIFDVDGTLCDNSERYWMKFQDNKQYLSLVLEDKPFPKVVKLAKQYVSEGRQVRFWTARDYDEKQGTLKWLQKFVSSSIKVEHVRTRAKGHNENENHWQNPKKLKPGVDASILKLGWAMELTGGDLSQIECLFDDRASTVKLFRQRGVRCVQPKPTWILHGKTKSEKYGK